MKTCKHFRYQLPREEADELRDADPEPCDVCDSLPHRRRRYSSPEPISSERPKLTAVRRARWLPLRSFVRPWKEKRVHSQS